VTACAEHRVNLGAYVLGSLDEPAIRATEAHLKDCAECRAEQDELAALPGLLDLAAASPPPVPARVRDRVVASAARRRARRRWTLAAAAAMVAAALLGGYVGWAFAPEPAPTRAVHLPEHEPYEATGWAVFRAEDGEIVVDLELRGLEPLPEPAVYEAWLSTYDERIRSMGQLEVRADGTATATLTLEGSLGDYRGFWVTAEPDRRDPAHAGPTVVAAPVPPPP
jgi:anti-sigma factor RsiW